MIGLGTLARVMSELREDVAAARDRDPAARRIGTTEILLIIKDNQPISIPEIASILKDRGKKGGHKSVAKTVERLGKRGYIAGDIGLRVMRLPRELMQSTAKRSSFDTDVGSLYWGWTTDHTDEEVAEQFEQAFGRKPEQVTRTGGGVMAGPIAVGERPASE